jgi:Sap, sulfolipid-1-addressing protein
VSDHTGGLRGRAAVDSHNVELALTALAAMLSPTTLTWSVLVLVLSKRPLRSGLWFYFGALGATLAVGVIAAFVIGDAAAPSHSARVPKLWVAIIDVVAALLLVALVIYFLRRPRDPTREEKAVAQISKVADSPIATLLGAGAVLANPGVFIPLGLKDISEMRPSTTGYIIAWVLFSLISLLPMAAALVLILVAKGWILPKLDATREWLTRNTRIIAAVIVLLLAASMLRNGIDGLIHA